MVVYPRWRGELFVPWRFAGSRAVYPAGAGNTLPLSALLARNTVYPRWRGEHRSSHYFLSSSTVYPRWRGEHVGRESFDCPYIGLSPLARGTHQRYRLQLTGSRFIPAGAGNTGKTNIGVRVVPVYPRWRGEHSIRRFCSSSDAGLSPLARGTLYYNRWTRYGARFIPAGAGNTNMGSAVNEIKTVYPAGAGNTRQLVKLRQLLPVYPRWRGEHPALSAR